MLMHWRNRRFTLRRNAVIVASNVAPVSNILCLFPLQPGPCPVTPDYSALCDSPSPATHDYSALCDALSPATPDSSPDSSLSTSLSSSSSMSSPETSQYACSVEWSSPATPTLDVPQSMVPFALLSAFSPPPSPQLLPLTVRISMLQLRLRKQAGRARQEAVRFYYMQRSEDLEAERYQELTLEGTTDWHHAQTNAYFDMKHHALLDSVESYLSQEEGRKRKRCPEEEAPCKRSRVLPTTTPATLPPAPAAPVTSTPVTSTPATSTPVNPVNPVDPVPRVKKTAKRIVGTPFNNTTTAILERWYDNNKQHPYPSYDTSASLAQSTGLTVEQVKKWFSNRRMRSRSAKSWMAIKEQRELTRSGYSRVLMATERRS